MSSRLINSFATTDALAAAFSDEVFLQRMLDFEAALARAEASAGLLPAASAAAITSAAVAGDFGVDAIVRSARSHATPSVALVELLEAKVAAIDPEASRWVHFGATSQDAFDTALVLCMRTAWPSLERDHTRLVQTVARLAGEHASTLMLGRTLLQPAAPITFGLKTAGWLGSLQRSWRACGAACKDAMVLQFGGAAGTLAALGDKGTAVEEALARELGLEVPDAPWHAHRDRLAALVAACGIYTGALAKIARDISLLMQHEVSEAFERGGSSSAMPHKRNPSGCAIVLAAANRLSGLVSAMLAGMPHEHERGVGGWQAEGATVAEAIQATGAAVSAMAEVVDGLTIDSARMRRNVDETRGAILAERVAASIAPRVGRKRASEMVKRAVELAAQSGSTLADAVAHTTELTALMPGDDISRLSAPDSYLGAADAFRQRLIAGASGAAPGKR